MGCWLSERAAKTPNAAGLVFEGQTWDFRALNAEAAQMAARLTAIDVQPGDRVAALMPNRPEIVFLVFALERLDAVLVPLNTRLTPQELRWQIEQTGCKALVCSAQTELQAAALGDLPLMIVTVDVPTQSGVNALTEIEPDGETSSTGISSPRDALRAIIFTSGTTGNPKGAMLTAGNFLASAIASRRRLGRETAAHWLLCMPLYHVGGLSIVLRCCLYGTAVILHDGFDVGAVNNALDRDGVTLVSLVPTMLHRLVEHRAGRPFPESLRCVLLGGAAASPKLIAGCIEQRIPVALTYGLTEAASQVATATPDEVRMKQGSVGRPLAGTSVRIVADDGAELPAGEIGEIVVSGPTVMKGYLGQPEATAEAVRDGWLYTGDLGYLDEDGFLWPVQRRSDLIVSGGENVYPAEVEAALETHLSVREACVVGIEDAEWGQRVAALVVSDESSPDAEALIAHCRETLAGYKCPRLIHFVEALPRTASGKVQRADAARLVEAWLAGERQAG